MRSLSGLGAIAQPRMRRVARSRTVARNTEPVPRRHPGDITNGPGPGLDTGKVPLAIGAQAVIGDMSGEERRGSRLRGVATFAATACLQPQVPHQAIDPAQRAGIARVLQQYLSSGRVVSGSGVEYSAWFFQGRKNTIRSKPAPLRGFFLRTSCVFAGRSISSRQLQPPLHGRVTVLTRRTLWVGEDGTGRAIRGAFLGRHGRSKLRNRTKDRWRADTRFMPR